MQKLTDWIFIIVGLALTIGLVWLATTDKTVGISIGDVPVNVSCDEYYECLKQCSKGEIK